MSHEIESAGFVWVEERDPDRLDRSKQYMIQIGREYWTLRYGRLNEWFCFRKSSDEQMIANSLIEAGCPIYVRREPIRWESPAIVLLSQGETLIEGLREPVPEALLNKPVKILILEDTEAMPDPNRK